MHANYIRRAHTRQRLERQRLCHLQQRSLHGSEQRSIACVGADAFFEHFIRWVCTNHQETQTTKQPLWRLDGYSIWIWQTKSARALSRSWPEFDRRLILSVGSSVSTGHCSVPLFRRRRSPLDTDGIIMSLILMLMLIKLEPDEVNSWAFLQKKEPDCCQSFITHFCSCFFLLIMYGHNPQPQEWNNLKKKRPQEWICFIP